MRTRRGDRAWMTWVIVTLTSFGVLEYLALKHRSFPTLSETMHRWMGVRSRRHWGVSPSLFLAFWVWFVVHLIRGRWGDTNVQCDVLEGRR